jgi:hypothetical protein
VALAYVPRRDALVLYDVAGGRRTQTGRAPWTPAVARLPPGITRLEAAGDVHLACAGDAAPAAWSDDAGETFVPAAFTCGQDGRRTTALVDGRAFVLLGPDTLGVGRPGGGELEPRVLPGPVSALAALPPTLLLFGDGVAWRSEDDGATFAPVSLPAGAPRVREALFLAKARVVAVGDAPDGLRGPALMISDDAGRRFAFPPGLPRHSGALAAVATLDAHLLAVPASPGEGLYSDDDARTFRLPLGTAGWTTAVTAARGGFVALRAPVPAGLPADVAGLGGVAPPQLDAAPLRDVAFPHPRFGLGIDAGGRLLRSSDGGRSWTSVGGATPRGLTGLARADDGYGLWLAAPEAVAFAPAPGGPARGIGVPCSGAVLRALSDGSTAARCSDGTWLRLRGPEAIEAFAAAPGTGQAAALLPADEDALVVLGRDGLRLSAAHAGGPWRTRTVPLPAGRHLVSIWTEGGALVALADDGRRWVLSRFDGALRALGAAPEVMGPVVTGLGLAGGEMVVATTTGILRVDAAGQWAELAPTTGVTTLRATGDGGLVALGDGATTVLTPR